MIHGDSNTINQQKPNLRPPLQFCDGQGSSDGFYERELVQQLPDENNSLYGINIGPFQNNETVDLRSIDTSDLLEFNTNESALNELIEASNLKMRENSPQMISNVFPNLEEHDHGGYQFELNLNPNTTGKSNWYYSSKLQKVFIKLDQTFYIDAIYSPKNTYDPLYLRAMMVFIDDISSPVQRCHNHMNSDLSSEINLRRYILRSENSNIRYEGQCDGRNVNDRLAVLIPLCQGRPNESNIVKHSIALKFVCQNSCIGRKQTAVIFTLEDHSCRILGKRVVNVKVCSCPKRDKQKDEEKYSLKRLAYDQKDCPPHKIPSIVKIKEEPPPSTSPLSNPVQTNDIERNSFQEIKYEINIPKHLAYEISRSIFNIITGQMALDAKNSEKYRKCLKEAKQKIDEFGCQQGSSVLRK